MKFLTELSVTPIAEQRWRVNKNLVCWTRRGFVIVPAGFVTDGASVPRPLWWLYPPFDGDYDAAAVLHDYAYQHAEEWKLTRAEADLLLWDGMAATKTADRKRRAIYAGVRLGGWAPWRRYRKQK